MKHPMQPIERGARGVIRFSANPLVQHLLDSFPGGADGLRQSCPDADIGDWEQFEQLVGYSVSGFGDLPHVSRETVEAADAIAAGV